MAIYTWNGTPGFTYSLDDTLPTLKDTVRVRIGDVNGEPIAYLSDNEIIAIGAQQNNDLFNTCADCAEACAFRCLSLYQEIQQGSAKHGLRIKNFDLAAAARTFMSMADMMRNKSTNGALPVYGALSGKICPPRAGYTQQSSYVPRPWQSILNPEWCP